MRIGGAIKKSPVSLDPKARPTLIEISIKYLVLSIKCFCCTIFKEKYKHDKKKKVSKDSVVPKWADWIRPGINAVRRAAQSPQIFFFDLNNKFVIK
jgi:hypothetical protein